MALIGVMVTPDRVWRVEVYRERGRTRYRVRRGSMPVGLCRSPEEVAELMAQLGGEFGDLVAD